MAVDSGVYCWGATSGNSVKGSKCFVKTKGYLRNVRRYHLTTLKHNLLQSTLVMIKSFVQNVHETRISYTTTLSELKTN